MKKNPAFYHPTTQHNTIMNTLQQHRSLEKSIKSHAIDGIDNLIGYESNIYGCDLHHELFNRDYFIIGRYQAKIWIDKHYGVFEAIGKIVEYEKDQFGEVSTELHEPERVCNMLTYILGEELLQESATLRNNWDNRLTDKQLKAIKREIKNAKLPQQ